MPGQQQDEHDQGHEKGPADMTNPSETAHDGDRHAEEQGKTDENAAQQHESIRDLKRLCRSVVGLDKRNPVD